MSMIMKNGFVRVACGAPKVFLADPVKNVDELIRLTKEAEATRTALIVFPELCVTGYTCADLFFNDQLIASAYLEFNRYLDETRNCSVVSLVGLPVVCQNRLYNCAAVCQKGEILGIVPKQHLPSHEVRCFSVPSASDFERIDLFGRSASIGTDMIFSCVGVSKFKLGVEIAEDFDALVPASARLIRGGATVICNLAASAEAVGKNELRRQMLKSYTKHASCCYLYASAGAGESTTDRVYGGHRLICECGDVLAEAEAFAPDCEILYTEIDLDRAAREQRLALVRENTKTLPTEVQFHLPILTTRLSRTVDPTPFFPSDKAALDTHCKTVLRIQSQGLAQRVEKAYAKKMVIGISGGLDSTLALLVAANTADLLGRPRTDILAVTMPCFGTTDRTKNNATVICEELGVDFRCICIGDAVNQHFKDIGHDPACHDVTYENSQARERTQILMDLANECGGMVIGTGDLSELALGWATYNGDHMSMYGVNANLPKTLIRHVVAYCAENAENQDQSTLASALRDILDTPVSPELLPANDQGEIAQKTEDLVGPYELHDFYLYHLLHNGYAPEKLYRLAKRAFGKTYSDEVLLKWLGTFLRRFFNQQFKRSCLPDGPAVYDIGLSPRDAWKMPSDASSAVWLREIEELKATLTK